jgi:hypothetical protein
MPLLPNIFRSESSSRERYQQRRSISVPRYPSSYHGHDYHSNRPVVTYSPHPVHPSQYEPHHSAYSAHAIQTSNPGPLQYGHSQQVVQYPPSQQVVQYPRQQVVQYGYPQQLVQSPSPYRPHTTSQMSYGESPQYVGGRVPHPGHISPYNPPVESRITSINTKYYMHPDYQQPRQGTPRYDRWGNAHF